MILLAIAMPLTAFAEETPNPSQTPSDTKSPTVSPTGTPDVETPEPVAVSRQLAIDGKTLYPGMDKTYENGYIPIVKDIFFYTPGVQFGFGGGSYETPAYNNDPNSDNAYSGTEITSVPFAFGFSADLGKFEFKPVDFLGVSFNLLDFSVLYNTVKNNAPDLKTSITSFTAGFNYGMSVGVKYYF